MVVIQDISQTRKKSWWRSNEKVVVFMWKFKNHIRMAGFPTCPPYFICREIGSKDSPACFWVKFTQREYLVQVVYGIRPTAITGSEEWSGAQYNNCIAQK